MAAAAPPVKGEAVAKAFAAIDAPHRERLMALRALIYEIAATEPQVGQLTETLKWGQPSYLTEETKSGTTIRLGCPKDGGVAVYVHCQTSILSDVQALFPKDAAYDGNRGLHVPLQGSLPRAPLEMLIRRALTYHSDRLT